MRKKAIFYIIAILLVVLLSLPQFWTFVNQNLNTSTQTSQLKFKSLFGKYTISLDGKSLGFVDDKQTQSFSQISPGERNVKISRNSSASGFYFDFEKKINFYPGTEVTIEWEAGPTLESSNGIIRYFNESSNQNGTEVQIFSFPPDALVEIDSKLVESKKINITDTSSHKVLVKSSGEYENKEFDISFNTVKSNLKHSVEVYLYKKPFVQE